MRGFSALAAPAALAALSSATTSLLGGASMRRAPHLPDRRERQPPGQQQPAMRAIALRSGGWLNASHTATSVPLGGWEPATPSARLSALDLPVGLGALCLRLYASFGIARGGPSCASSIHLPADNVQTIAQAPTATIRPLLGGSSVAWQSLTDELRRAGAFPASPAFLEHASPFGCQMFACYIVCLETVLCA